MLATQQPAGKFCKIICLSQVGRVGRALHRYRSGHGFESRSSLNFFFRFLFPQLLKLCVCGRRGGLMVSALDSGASGQGCGPALGHCVVFLGKTLILTVPLSTQVYKCILANLMLGGNPAMD